MRALSIVLSFILIFGCINAPAAAAEETAPVSIPAPPANTHPRVLFTAGDTERIKKSIDSPENAYAKEVYTSYAGSYIEIPDTYKPQVLDRIECKALYYALNGDSAVGEEAITALNAFLSKDYDLSSKADYSRYYGRIVNVIAEVYDWCYSLLDSGEKEALIADAIQNAEQMEISKLGTVSASFIGHAAEAQLLRDLLSLAIAVYDERPDIWERVGGLFYSKYVPVREFINGAGYHHQGTGYGLYRHSWDSYAYKLICAMGLDEPYRGEALTSVSLGMLYMRRPDGEYIKDGDISLKTPPYSYRSSDALAYLLDFSISGNPYLKGEYLRQSMVHDGNIKKTRFTDDLTPALHLILNRTEVEPRSNEELPLTSYMNTPVGMMIARSGWNDGIASDTVVAQMKVGEYHFGNHQHLDSGAFQIYYKGILAANGTDYDSYGSVNNLMYSQKSIASNTMLIYDPSESADDTASISNTNDGGQRYYAFNENTDFSQNVQKARVEAYETDPKNIYKPSYSYIKGDITNAYSANKLDLYKRSFMYLNLNDSGVPAAMVVFDKVNTTDETYKKIWLMHSVEKPDTLVNNNTLATIVTRKGSYSGKMTIDTLLPLAENLDAAIYGGDGEWSRVNKYEYNQSTKKWDITDSQNYPSASETAGSESLCYRLELSPKTAEKENYFLNVIQVGDSDSTRLEVTKTDTALFYGAAISDRAVMFSKSGEKITDGFTLTAPKEGRLQYTICDMSKGKWLVGDSEYTVTEEGGVLAFTSSEADISIQKISDTAEPVQPQGTPDLKNNFCYIKNTEDSFLGKTADPLWQNGCLYLSLDDIAAYKGCIVEYKAADNETTALICKDGKTIAGIKQNDNYILTDKGAIKTSAPALIEHNGIFMTAIGETGKALWQDMVIDESAGIIFITPSKPTTEAVYYAYDQNKLKVFLNPKNTYSADYICALYSENELNGIKILEKDSSGIYRASLDCNDIKNTKIKLFKWTERMEPLGIQAEPILAGAEEVSTELNNITLTPDSALGLTANNGIYTLAKPAVSGDRTNTYPKMTISGGAHGTFGNTDTAELVHYSLCFSADKLQPDFSNVQLRLIREGSSHIVFYYDKSSGCFVYRDKNGDTVTDTKWNIGEDYRADVIVDINNQSVYLYIDGMPVAEDLDYSNMEKGKKLLSAALYLTGCSDEEVKVNIKNVSSINYTDTMQNHAQLLEKVKNSINTGVITVQKNRSE